MTTYSGWQLVAYIATGSTLDSITGSGQSNSSINVQRIDVDYTQNLTVHEATGLRTAFAITEGVIGVSGTIERFYSGSGAFGWARGSGSSGETDPLAEKYIGIFPNGTSSGQPYEIINQVKFGSRRTSTRPGNTLRTEVMDFIGVSVSTGSI